MTLVSSVEEAEAGFHFSGSSPSVREPSETPASSAMTFKLKTSEVKGTVYD